MPRKCWILRRRDSLATVSSLVEQCGLLAQEVDGEKLDERGISEVLAAEPYAIVLPLSLSRYASLRIAEHVALRRARVRLILVSGTRAPDSVLNEMFDRRLPQCGDGLIDALQQPGWTHAFERRGSTIDEAIQCILRTASCFWLSGGRHPEAFATVVDYHRAVAEASRHLTLLFLASDPTHAARLRLMKELSVIEEELTKRSEYTFSCKYIFSSRPDELARRLLEEKPHVVHFSGHGDAGGRLCFENVSGGSWPADTAAIAQIFEPLRRYTKCVVLNACFSAEQARLIGKHIEYTVGFKSSVSDDAAIAMARGFYGVLSATGRVSSAIQSAQANLRLMPSGAAEVLCCAHKVPSFGAYTARR